MLSTADVFDGRRTTSAILILRSRVGRAPASCRLDFPGAPLRNCDAAHANVPPVYGLPSANSVADCPLHSHASIRSAQIASVFGFMPPRCRQFNRLRRTGSVLRILFNKVRRNIKGSDRRSRSEAFLEWAEENPGEIYAMQEQEAAREIKRLVNEYQREARGSGDAHVPF